MSAEENVATMRRAYEAFNTDDIDTLVEVFDENMAWHLPGKSKFASDYQGRDATLEELGKIGPGPRGTFGAELQERTADDAGRVVGIQRSSGDRNGKHLDVNNCSV